MKFTTTTRLMRSTIPAALALALCFSASSKAVEAATPADTLVIAMSIDDIISLDPAEIFEITTSEMLTSTYERLVTTDIKDPTKIIPQIAESWTFSEDGKSITFKIRDGLKFASGNPITAQDAAYSIQRAIKLDKSPAFILSQFGITPENVEQNAVAVDDKTFVFTTGKPFAPSFVMNCLTSSVASIVDSKLVKEHEQKTEKTDTYPFETDFGYEWLKNNYAGSGPFALKQWRANEVLLLERNDNYTDATPAMKRIIYRHVKEGMSQRLLLEAGDIDIARNLEPGDIEQLAKDSKFNVINAPKGRVYYLSMNQNVPELAKPEVRQALKYLIDYDTIEGTLIKGIGRKHQSFLPVGMFGATDDNPFDYNVEKAKELLEKAGLKDGISVTLDVRNNQPYVGIAESIQQTMAKAGVNVEILQGDGKLTTTKVRARKHQLALGIWGPDYWDPHTNAVTFTNNPNNGDEVNLRTTAWQASWDIPELTAETMAAAEERDTTKREAMYKDIQKKFQETSPIAVIYQQIETAVTGANVHNFDMVADANYVATVTKD
ncbi:ABC transporter substrate-binding protein [Brucella pseudogrignonensis]|uniref:Peptide/nickel transport system substrate-binding protein n=1 Tax=Brucella pseudogrignonensis TaxID=419475 RepID=A0ABU1M880_9HYPH|nr:ABC transporter substrate-binding protein [Brucella pseudogrignonensis]MDR6432244.1 peptide/nickel transport system substrate-binding protein [Brucella pseudogrignonensis]